MRIFEANIQRILRKAYLVESINNFITYENFDFDKVIASIKKFVTDSTKEEVFKEYGKIKALSDCYNPDIDENRETVLNQLKAIQSQLSNYNNLIADPEQSLNAQKMIFYYKRLEISAVRKLTVEEFSDNDNYKKDIDAIAARYMKVKAAFAEAIDNLLDQFKIVKNGNNNETLITTSGSTAE